MIETIVIGSLLGREVVTQTISQTTKSVYYGVTGLMSNEHFLLKDVLEELDINPKISTINSLMSDIEKRENINDTVHLCLNHLHDIIAKINNEIVDINKEIELDKEKWFRYFRTPNYIKKVHNLRIHKRIMDERLELLIKMIKL